MNCTRGPLLRRPYDFQAAQLTGSAKCAMRGANAALSAHSGYRNAA